MQIEKERFLDQVTQWLQSAYSKQLDLAQPIEVSNTNIEFSLIQEKQNSLSDGFHNYPIFSAIPEQSSQLSQLKLQKIQFFAQILAHKLDLTADLIMNTNQQLRIKFPLDQFSSEKSFLEIYEKHRIRGLRGIIERETGLLNPLRDIIFPQISSQLNLKQVWSQEGQFITEKEAMIQQKQLKEERKSVLGFLAQKKKVRQIEKEMLIHGKPVSEPQENLQTGLRQELGEQSEQLKQKIQIEQKRREQEVQQQAEEKVQAPDIPEEEAKKLQEFVKFYKENDIDMRANIDSHKRDISQLKGHLEEDRQLLKKRPYIGMGVDYQKKQENLRNAMEQQQTQPIYDPIDMLNVPMEAMAKQQMANVPQAFPQQNRNSFLDTDISFDIIQRERQKKKTGGVVGTQIPKQKKEQKEVNIEQFKGLQFDLTTIQELKEQKQMNN